MIFPILNRLREEGVFGEVLLVLTGEGDELVALHLIARLD